MAIKTTVQSFGQATIQNVLDVLHYQVNGNWRRRRRIRGQTCLRKKILSVYQNITVKLVKS